ncbi:MAG TPA: S9 family peptidase [Steroidobacteraceae bacterium]|jgi:dipeptidyl aminopeptidase/acylaminoacyl peptidase
MQKGSWCAVLCAVSLWTLPAGAAAPAVDELASLADHGAVSLSRDGKRIAYTGRVGDKRALMVMDLEKRTNKAILAAEEDTFQIRWCRFKSDVRILCGLAGVGEFRGNPFPRTRLIAIDADGGGFKVLVQRHSNALSQFQDDIIDWRIDDPKTVYVQLSPDGSNSPFPDVYALNVESGLKTMIQKQRYPIRDWFADKDGTVRYGGGCDEHERCEYVTRASAREPWQVLSRWQAYQQDDFSVLGFGPTGKTLLVTELFEDRLAVYQLDLEGKAEKELVFSHPEVDVGGALHWPAGSGRVAGFWYDADRTHREFFDGDAAAVYELLDKSLPDSANAVVSSARGGKLLLVSAVKDVAPRAYYLLDLEKKSLSRLGALMPDVPTDTFGTMKSVRIKARDGTSLPGYLTLPPGKPAEKLPMVVYPHGGPHARDDWGFDPVVQLMVSRGYAVLQVNFRGSVGYGRAWYEAGLRKWGSVMVDDINASTHWAIDQGYADPARICIVGWSFGGYAALMAGIHERTLYKCVGSIAGVADLKELRRQEWRFYGGAAAADAIIGSDLDDLAEASPLKSTRQILAPVLLVHGTSDIAVDVDQSRRMANALERVDRLEELVLIDGGDHSLSRSAWRKTLYEKLDGFLRKYLQ